jgi:hypothetical protein
VLASRGGGYRTTTTRLKGRREVSDKSEGVGDALERDWEQTKSDMPGMEGEDLGQDVDDTLKQAVGKEPVPDETEPNRD